MIAQVFLCFYETAPMFQFNFDNLKTITIGNNNVDIKFSVQDTNNPHNQKMENTNNLKGFG